MESEEAYQAKPRVPRTGGRIVQRIHVDGKAFELQYVKCGKAGCARCTIGGVRYDPDRPGHGPYWYRIIRNSHGQLIRKYVGKELTSG